MLFSSMLFLWAFFPVTVILHRVVPRRAKNAFLLLASLFFYAWGEPKYWLLLVIMIAVNWALGLGIARAEAGWRKAALAAAVLANLLLLSAFKYTGLAIDTLNGVFGAELLRPRHPLLPLGISFFTFRALTYAVDLYRGKYPAAKNVFRFALYISFFPQLTAGPIVPYAAFYERLDAPDLSAGRAAEGVRRFAYGLAKKALLANTLAACADGIFSLPMEAVSGAIAWTGMLVYALQIYYDFSGYSDMAIGLSAIFGFPAAENFRYPYVSRSISEFWRRWHISLGSFFREYLYIPLGGNRKGLFRTCVNLLIVFLATGLWHGASYNFIFWGLYYAAFLIAERLFLGKLLEKAGALSLLYSLPVVGVGWVFFRLTSLADGFRFAERLLLFWRYPLTTYSVRELVSNKVLFAAAVAILGAGAAQRLLAKTGLAERLKGGAAEMICCAALVLLSFFAIAGESYQPFIYFRF